MSTPFSMRTMRLACRSASSMTRASLLNLAAQRTARFEGAIESSLTILPSDLETIFCATTKIFPRSMGRERRATASTMTLARSSPGTISGIPVSGIISTSEGARDFLTPGCFAVRRIIPVSSSILSEMGCEYISTEERFNCAERVGNCVMPTRVVRYARRVRRARQGLQAAGHEVGSRRTVRRLPAHVSRQVEAVIYFDGSTWRLFVTENTFGTLFA